MILTRTEQIWVEPNDGLSELCHFSKNLWNEANYLVRQDFFNNGHWTRYNTLAGTFKSSENYKNINAQTAQQILKILDKESIEHHEKYMGKRITRGLFGSAKGILLEVSSYEDR